MNKQTGFGVIEILVAVIVVAVLAAAGYLFVQGLDKQNVAETENKSSTESATVTHEDHEEMMANWKVFSSDTYGFTFKHPESWTITEAPDISFPDKSNVVVKNQAGEEVLGIYGYLGTGCEAPVTGNEPTQDVAIGDSEVTVTKDCNSNWSWITADTQNGTNVTITTWNFIGQADEEDALMLLSSVVGLTNVVAN